MRWTDRGPEFSGESRKLRRARNGDRVRIDLPAIDEAKRSSCGLTSEKNVACNIERIDDFQFLMNDADAVTCRFPRRTDHDGLAVDPDRSGIGLMNPGQNFHQGGFTRAIFADERDDFTARDIESDGIPAR